jgi:ABC-type oligopeptide transport system substrate-binding subunit
MKPISTFLTFLTLLTFSLFFQACKPKSQSPGVETRTGNGQSILYVDMDQCRDTIDFDISAIVDSCRVIRLENRTVASAG